MGVQQRCRKWVFQAFHIERYSQNSTKKVLGESQKNNGSVTPITFQVRGSPGQHSYKIKKHPKTDWLIVPRDLVYVLCQGVPRYIWKRGGLLVAGSLEHSGFLFVQNDSLLVFGYLNRVRKYR
jgi:hypothetical protein